MNTLKVNQGEEKESKTDVAVHMDGYVQMSIANPEGAMNKVFEYKGEFNFTEKNIESLISRMVEKAGKVAVALKS
jgi:hypothetical protein